MIGMPQTIAQDKLSLIEEHIPNPDRFAVCLCTRDGGESFGVYIDDLFTSACAVVDDEIEADRLVRMLCNVEDNPPFPPYDPPPFDRG